MNYQELIEDVKEIWGKYTIVGGFMDIYIEEPKHTNQITHSYIKQFDNYWIYVGNIDNEDLINCFLQEYYNVFKPGCYQFDAVLKYERPEYGDYGRVIDRGGWYIDYIDLKLDHTFEQRERDSKLNELLGGELSDIFSI